MISSDNSEFRNFYPYLLLEITGESITVNFLLHFLEWGAYRVQYDWQCGHLVGYEISYSWRNGSMMIKKDYKSRGTML